MPKVYYILIQLSRVSHWVVALGTTMKKINWNIFNFTEYNIVNKIRGNVKMEYAKDEIFSIKYNSSIDRLQFKKQKWTSKIIEKINRHRIISSAIILFILLASMNFILIYNFMNILQTVYVL